MKSVQYKSTLVYYDGPQVFEARDQIGGHYVAVMVGTAASSETPSDGTSNQYLVVGVAPEQLRLFRVGEIDLRSLLLDADEDERYLATMKDGVNETLELERLTMPIAESGFLPDEGFLLHDDKA